MPQPGEILLYKDYTFEDGSTHDKLFVILLDSPCLALKTTSQAKRYQGVKEGCNVKQKVFFLPASRKEGFPKDTYIQLPQIFEFSSTELLQGALSKKQITILKSISPPCLKQIKHCVQQFQDDISEEHWNALFHQEKGVTKNSLQKLAEKFNKKD